MTYDAATSGGSLRLFGARILDSMSLEVVMWAKLTSPFYAVFIETACLVLPESKLCRY